MLCFRVAQQPAKPSNQPAAGNRKRWGAQDSWDDWDEFGLDDLNKSTGVSKSNKMAPYVPASKKLDFDDDDFLKYDSLTIIKLLVI